MAFQWDEWIHGLITNSTVKKIVRNPFVTAIIIVILFVVIAHFIFYEEESAHGKTLVKFGFYGFVATLPMIFLHYKNMEDDYEKRVQGKTEIDLLREIQNADQPVPETPTVGKGESSAPVTPAIAAVPAPSVPAPSVPAPSVAAPQVQVVVQAPTVKSPMRPVLRTPTNNK